MNNPSDNETHLSNLVDKSRSKSRKMPLRIPIHQIDMTHSRQAPLKEVVLVTRGSTTIPTQQLEPTSPVDSSFYLRQQGESSQKTRIQVGNPQRNYSFEQKKDSPLLSPHVNRGNFYINKVQTSSRNIEDQLSPKTNSYMNTRKHSHQQQSM